MQKTTQKASILIWSIFLSLIIITTFLSVSSKINKNLLYNSSIQRQVSIIHEVNNSIKNGNLGEKDLGDNRKLSFENLQNFQKTLQINQTENILLAPSTNLSIRIITGGPLYYKNSSASGIISTSTTMNNISGTVVFKNLGGYTQFSIDSNNDILKDTISYKVTKIIGNIESVIQEGRVKSF